MNNRFIGSPWTISTENWIRGAVVVPVRNKLGLTYWKFLLELSGGPMVSVIPCKSEMATTHITGQLLKSQSNTVHYSTANVLIRLNS